MTYPIDMTLFNPPGDYLVSCKGLPETKIEDGDFLVVHSTSEVTGLVVGVVRDLNKRGTK